MEVTDGAELRWVKRTRHDKEGIRLYIPGEKLTDMITKKMGNDKRYQNVYPLYELKYKQNKISNSDYSSPSPGLHGITKRIHRLPLLQAENVWPNIIFAPVYTSFFLKQRKI